MDAIHQYFKPELRRPQVVVAFEGWNDACDAASGAATYLLGHFDAAEPFAVLEPEQFFDFQEQRPIVSIDDGGTRSLSWPSTRFYAVALPDRDRDLVVVVGHEPHLRWKTFSRRIAQFLADQGSEDALLMGAFIGQVAHTLPVPIIGVATDPADVQRLGLMTSRYEGPTGIIGVMLEAFREEGIPALSLWAATPHYLAANPNPKAMLALVEQSASVLGLGVDTSELRQVTTEFSQRVDEAMETSGDFADYVERLEQEGQPAMGMDASDSDSLVSEIEDFLREQG
ncbi:MAG: PAC2 family protein [Acidimicrobiia bacterium]|nr:PAC2 family protein [Acidimicrobiia bacterium]NNC75365.1 PAC2 family protein [Acidimicrobiia bacterium]